MSLKLDKTTINFIQEQLGYISYQFIKQFTNKLAPNTIEPQENIFCNLYHAIIKFYKEKMYGKVPLNDITNDIIAKANRINEQFASQLRTFLQTNYFKGILKSAVDALSENSRPNLIQQMSQSYSWAKRIEQAANAQSRAIEPLTARPNIFKNETALINKLGENKLTEVCTNLLDKPQCLCENQREIEPRSEFSFKCAHCNRYYHVVCMKKKATSQFCCYCHLERMIPLKKSVKTIFVGYLRKTKKKHSATIIIPQVEAHQKLQFRCLRLKEDAQQACLFPDVAELSMNGQRCNLFEPINRQSCLKYRKDEPLNLLKGDYYKGQDNHLLISQSVTLNRQKDIRNDPQNHLIGLYVVEDIKIDQFINMTKKQNILGFSQSESVLQGSFGLGKDDEITCELVKIPLLCPLTTVKIQIPVRGYYCSHFQCFDLKNYLTLISQSQNPRWRCPLCNSMAFQLKIDSILMEIINETGSNEKIKEILFFKNGDYSAIINQEPLLERKNIRSLHIPEKIKPRMPESEPSEKVKPKKKPNFIIPENVQVISLDD